MELLHGDLRALFRRYLWTALGSAVIFSIYNTADVICVGQYEGPVGVAALSCMTPIWNVFISVGLLLGIGGSIRMSWARGRGSRTDGERYFTISFLLGLAASLLISAVMIGCAPVILQFCGAEGEVLRCALDYGVWLFPAIPLFTMGHILSAFIRNDGIPELCTAAVLTGGGLNIVLDIYFVFGLNMGISGAGLGTVIGQSVAVCILATYFVRKRCKLRLRRPVRTGWMSLGIVQAGIVPFLVELFYGVTVTMFNNQIMRYGSSAELAVYSTVCGLGVTFQSLFSGIGQAVQPIVSANFGAQQQARCGCVLRMALRTAVVMGVAFFALPELLPAACLRLFMDADDNILAIGPGIVRMYAVSFLFMGINVVSGYYLQSILRNSASAVISLARGILFCTLFVYLLPAAFPFGAIWWTMPLTELCTFIVVWLLMKQRGRQDGAVGNVR